MTKKQVDKRKRYGYQFYLDLNKPDEYNLACTCEELKANRQFRPSLRDALRLLFDLRRGSIDVLLELFPGIVEKIKSSQPPPPPTPPPDNITALTHEIERLRLTIQAAPKPAVIASGEYLQPVINGHSKIGLDMLDMPSLFVDPTDCPEDPAIARLAFAGGMGNLFADEDEDLWD